jgi:hypothetical protein
MDIQKGETFADGQIVNASRLNNLADLATILATFISDKSPIAADATDYLVVFDTSTNSLKKTPFSGGVSSVGLTMPGEFNVVGSPITTTGTLAGTWKPVAKNKVLIGPASGGDAVPTFRTLTGADIAGGTSVNIAASNIDWSLGSSFWKLITTNTVFSFSNNADGMTIKVLVTQSGGGGHTLSFPASVVWPGGIEPPLGTANGSTNLYVLQQINAAVIGVGYQQVS